MRESATSSAPANDCSSFRTAADACSHAFRYVLRADVTLARMDRRVRQILDYGESGENVTAEGLWIKGMVSMTVQCGVLSIIRDARKNE